MSVKDAIKNSFMEADVFNRAITGATILSMLTALLAALLLGLLIGYTYKKLFVGVIYSRAYSITLTGMCVLSCAITLAISTNIVISLGMVGALSIVRYRTAVKEPLDLLYMFWAITAGISLGAYMYILIAIASLVMVALLYFQNFRQVAGQVYVMLVHYDGDAVGDAVKRALAPYKHQVKSQTARKEYTEMAVELRLKENNPLLIESIRDIEGVTDVTLMQYNGEYHG